MLIGPVPWNSSLIIWNILGTTMALALKKEKKLFCGRSYLSI
jgi:hypothetical protein